MSDPLLDSVRCPNPLDSTHLNQLNAALQAIHATELLIAKCKACSIPVEQAEADTAQQKQIVQSIKAQFFPNNA